MDWVSLFIYSLVIALVVHRVDVILMRNRTAGTLVINVDEDGSYILSLELDKEIPDIKSKYYANFKVVTRHWSSRG